jgi:signal transduction histidine kinase
VIVQTEEYSMRKPTDDSGAVLTQSSSAVATETLPSRPTGAGDRSVDRIAGGLATIASERTGPGIFRAACALATRLPGVSGVAVLRPDERGLLAVVYAIPTGIPAELVATASASLHNRWIGSHAPGASSQALGPYQVDDRPELLIVPLVSGDSLLGALLIAGKRGTATAAGSAERISAGAIGAVTALALEIAGLRQRQESVISLAEHEAELTTARKKIGRELHDGPTQDLALAGLSLDRLVNALGADQAISADARQARDLIDRAVLSMRKSIGRLRASTPVAPSITGPLRELLAEMAPYPAGTQPDFQVDFQQVSGVRRAPELERAMIGIVREALHNVRKHANADSVRLEARRVDDAVEIAVTDDGVGIQGSAQAGHFGLEQIRELAEETGGKMEITPAAADGAGTAVKAWIPATGSVTGPFTDGAGNGKQSNAAPEGPRAS